MNRLILLLGLSVLATTVYSAPELYRKHPAPKFNLNILTDALKNPNLVNNIVKGVDQLKEAIDNNLDSNSVTPGMKLDDLIGSAPEINLGGNMTIPAEQVDFLLGLLQVNLEYLLNSTNLLGSATQGILLDLVPQLLQAKNETEVLALLNPLILTGIGMFFQDPYILFHPTPYLEATRRFLQMFFASPDAPEFLKDPAMQMYILGYVEELFALNDINVAAMQLGMDVFMYLNAATSQELKPLVGQYLPELYALIENETDLAIIFEIVTSYVVTQGLELYQIFMNLLNPILMKK